MRQIRCRIRYSLSLSPQRCQQSIQCGQPEISIRTARPKGFTPLINLAAGNATVYGARAGKFFEKPSAVAIHTEILWFGIDHYFRRYLAT
jgi:hypothetical protein